MRGGKCRGCRMYRVCRDTTAAWIFFGIGVIATVALRAIEPLNSLNQFYGKLSWYVGVFGFFVFFVYKYRIAKERSRIIRFSGLKERLASGGKLTGDEHAILQDIVCSQDSWMERTNFLVIFALSALALAYTLYVDLIM